MFSFGWNLVTVVNRDCPSSCRISGVGAGRQSSRYLGVLWCLLDGAAIHAESLAEQEQRDEESESESEGRLGGNANLCKAPCVSYYSSDWMWPHDLMAALCFC